jgi:hypothetical protein
MLTQGLKFSLLYFFYRMCLCKHPIDINKLVEIEVDVYVTVYCAKLLLTVFQVKLYEHTLTHILLNLYLYKTVHSISKFTDFQIYHVI